MGEERSKDDRSGDGEVQITIEVVPGRVTATLGKVSAGRRVRAWMASVGVIAALAGGAIVVVLSGGGRAGRAPSGALATQFGPRTNCTRRTVASPEGDYARIDVDRSGACGTFGYQMTLVLHRVHGAWVRAFEASSWRCPVTRLPRLVTIELQLCSSAAVSSRPAASPPRGVL